MLIEVAVIDDQDVIRMGIAHFLTTAHQIHFAGGFANVESFCRSSVSGDTDVVLLDDTLPAETVAQSASRLRKQHPDLAIVILGRALDAERMQQLLIQGVTGFVCKEEPLGDILITCIRHVHSGRVYFSPEAALIGTRNDEDITLSPRQMQVLKLIARGEHVQQMALALDISPRALYAARQRLRQAFGVRTDAQVVAEALRRGLLHEG